MAALTKTTAENIKTVEGNGLYLFIDDIDNTLKLKDVHGNLVPFVTIGPTPPANAFIGQFWVEPTS